jgi:serine/threonine protein kinase
LGQGASGIVRKVVAVESSQSHASDAAASSNSASLPEPLRGRWDGVAFKQFRGIRGSDGHPSDEVAIARILSQSSMTTDINDDSERRGSDNLLPILGCIAEPLTDGDASNKDDFNYGIIFPMIPEDCKLLAGPPSFQSVTRDVYSPDAKFSVDVVMEIVKGIAAACSRLHSLGIMHGDVYGHNIHVYEDGHPVLVDLGASTLYGRYHPDISEAHDSPLGNADVVQLCERIEIRAFSYLVEELVDRINPEIADANPSCHDITLQLLKEIISLCQVEDVISRPTFDQICKMLL